MTIYPLTECSRGSDLGLSDEIEVYDSPRDLPGDSFHPFVCVEYLNGTWRSVHYDESGDMESKITANDLDESVERAEYLSKTKDAPLVTGGFGGLPSEHT